MGFFLPITEYILLFSFILFLITNPNHYKSLQIITNHYKSLQIITNYYKCYKIDQIDQCNCVAGFMTEWCSSRSRVGSGGVWWCQGGLVAGVLRSSADSPRTSNHGNEILPKPQCEW